MEMISLVGVLILLALIGLLYFLAFSNHREQAAKDKAALERLVFRGDPVAKELLEQSSE